MLAAAAIYALDNHVERLAEDHRRASVLVEAIESNSGLTLTRRVDTNMVFFNVKSGKLAEFSDKLTESGILHDWMHFNLFRLVTHLDIDDAMIEYTVETLKSTAVTS